MTNSSYESAGVPHGYIQLVKLTLKAILHHIAISELDENKENVCIMQQGIYIYSYVYEKRTAEFALFQ